MDSLSDMQATVWARHYSIRTAIAVWLFLHMRKQKFTFFKANIAYGYCLRRHAELAATLEYLLSIISMLAPRFVGDEPPLGDVR